VKRALPLQQAVISLCLIHKAGSQQEHNCFHWLLTAFEENKMMKREETLISSSLSSPCLIRGNIRGAIFLEERKNQPFPGHKSVTEAAAEISC